MIITPQTISREIVALKKSMSSRGQGTDGPFYLFIGPSTHMESVAAAVEESGEDVVVIQDVEYHDRFMICNEETMNWLGGIS